MTTRKEKRRALRNNKQENGAANDFPSAKKSLGQNFLQDKKFLDMIVKAASLEKDDQVLEIGPGTGLLTDQLTKSAKRVFCVEKDPRMTEFLTAKYSLEQEDGQQGKVEILQKDILMVNLPQLLQKKDFYDYKVVANIPYYITGKILRLLLETEIKPKLMVLLVQKEVAQRICSKAGSMSILAVSVQYYGEAKLIETVPKTAFFPVPKVDSAIICVKPVVAAKRESAVLQKKFFQVVKSGFASPRKKLLNNLAASLKLDKEELRSVFAQLKWDEKLRAQDLSIVQWKQLRDRIL